MAFGGSTSANTKPHTHNQTLVDDGGQLSETLTDMNGVVLYSLITDNSTAVAANTAAIALINSVPSGLVAIWSSSIASIPSGWTLFADIPSVSQQTTQTDARGMYNGQPRTQMAQQFNTGHVLVGKKPSKVTWYLYKNGSPTGSVNSYIRNSSGVIRETSSTTIDPSTLAAGSGSATAQEFTFAGTTELATGDMVTVEYSGGDAANLVGVKSDNTAAVPDSIMRQYTGSWADVAGEAMTYIVNWDEAYIQKS